MQNDENSIPKSEKSIEKAEGNSSADLHKQFVKLGDERRKLTNELLALLPEINERGIFKKYAGSIVEYAGKFGGLSKGVVLKRLRLEKYLKDKLKLKEAIRTEGIHKVGMMASLATAENEDFIVDKIKNMSKSAVQELSKEMRANKINENLFGEAIKTTTCKAVPQQITIELDEEMSFLFLKLKKRFGKNLSNKEVMRRILEMADSQFNKNSNNKKLENLNCKINVNPVSTDQKVIPGDNFPTQDQSDSIKKKYKIDHATKSHSKPKGEQNERSENIINDYILQEPTTRYIPSKIKKQIISKTNGKCSYPNCNKPAEIFHHTDRFAECHSHNSLKLLCKEHHEFTHNGLIRNEIKESNYWSLNLDNQKLNQIDRQYRENKLRYHT